MKIGIINPGRLIDAKKHLVAFTCYQFDLALSRIRNIEIVPPEEADYVIGHFNQFSPDYKTCYTKKYDGKFIYQMNDCRITYRGKHLSKILQASDAVMCTGTNLDGFKRFDTKAFYLPFGTYPIDIPENKKDFVAITLRYGEPHRKKAVEQYVSGSNLNFKLYSLISEHTQWGQLGKMPNVIYERDIGTKAFEENKFNLEAKSKSQIRLTEEILHWSDRPAIVASFGGNLITDYKPGLDNWDSAIAYGEKVEYNKKDIDADIKRWDWKKMIEETLKEVISEL